MAIVLFIVLHAFETEDNQENMLSIFLKICRPRRKDEKKRKNVVR